MSGRILIIDALATNRIVLKVKLSSAYYGVSQAETGQDALRQIRANAPDLILASAALPDMHASAFLAELRNSEQTADIPVVMVLPDNADSARLALLKAGANDVIAKPVEEDLLLARLRSLLRQRLTEQDLKVHAGTAQALGFAEVSRAFHCPGRVALVGDDKTAALRMKATMAESGNNELIALAAEQSIALPPGTPKPELFLLHLAEAGADGGLRLMAELRAAPASRNAAVIVMLDSADQGLASTALDMGADDVVASDIPAAELDLRINAQLRKKRATDRMRNQLKTGLHAAVIDPLTGLYNRRYALPYLERLAAAAWDGDRPFAVMVADLDHFKQVNDRFGHAAGDAVLSRVAHELRNQLGENDLIARIGGEEFLIAIPDTTRAEARQIACRLRRVVEETPISFAGLAKPLQVTISIGATMALPHQGPRPRVTTLLDQADRALYGAKADGRNTVSLAAKSAA